MSREDLTKRWLTLQSSRNQAPLSPPKKGDPLDPKNLSSNEELVITLPVLVYICMLKPPFKQKTWVQTLQEPVVWFGNVAAGQSKLTPEWWEVIPPYGPTYAFIGDAAKECAMGLANLLEDHFRDKIKQ
jgi:hypothetical protein